jgi:hypothetical protein
MSGKTTRKRDRLRPAIDAIVEHEAQADCQLALADALRKKPHRLEGAIKQTREVERHGALVLAAKVALAMADAQEKRPTWLPESVTAQEARDRALQLRVNGYSAAAIARVFSAESPAPINEDNIRRTVTNWLTKK